jgi:hypothetical protein
MHPMKSLAVISVVLVALTIAGCNEKPLNFSKHPSYKLYRSSMVGSDLRIHIATFDADAGIAIGAIKPYNLENCEVARDLFQAQPGVKVKFWCE